jgi:ferredoxin
VQWATTAVVLVIGAQFTLWVRAHLSGVEPPVGRPPGVEAFLPLNAMLTLKHLILTGVVDRVHPAGLAIFLGVCLMSLVVARSFCSHLCPVGLLSELTGRAGARALGRNLALPGWLDLPLRGLKWLLLAFFAWAIWWSMGAEAVADFIASPYARVADAKMWLFFARPSRLTVAVLGVLAVGSFFVRDLWCRYLCPYGALVGLLGRIAPLKVERDPAVCTDCRACSRVCPARLPVHAMTRVASVECTGCQDCVAACPARGCLEVRPPRLLPPPGRRALRPVVVVAVAVGLYLAVVTGFRLAGRWHTGVSEAEYRRRLAEIDSPLYTHVGALAASEPTTTGAPGASTEPHSLEGAVASHPVRPLSR